MRITLNELRSLIRSEVRKTLRENEDRKFTPNFNKMGFTPESGLKEKAIDAWDRIKDSYYEAIEGTKPVTWIDTLISLDNNQAPDIVYERIAEQLEENLS